MASGKLTTHILDITHGCPADRVMIELYRIGTTRELIGSGFTNADGRTDAPMLEAEKLKIGVYELEFHIGNYFRRKMDIPATPFCDVVPIRFGVDDEDDHYHVPLSVSPFGYSTYRGS